MSPPLEHGAKRSRQEKTLSKEPSLSWAAEIEPRVSSHDVLDRPNKVPADFSTRQVSTFRWVPFGHPQRGQSVLKFEFFFGSPEIAAIFVPILSEDEKRKKKKAKNLRRS